MCGIAGFFEIRQQKCAENCNTKLLQSTLDLIAHRGPDDSGIESADWYALGHQRLSILDPMPGISLCGARKNGISYVITVSFITIKTCAVSYPKRAMHSGVKAIRKSCLMPVLNGGVIV